jgi:phosphatidylglycerol---prolipoprotein diacylglyceryl transferase
MIEYPNISPIIFSLGPFQVRWYGLAYLAGILLGGLLIKKPLHSKLALNNDQIINFLTYIMIGVFVGGRLGYVFIYNPSFYLHHPLEIFALWKGGMAFHGGALGAAVSVFVFAKHNNRNAWIGLDLLSIGATVGLTFGRLANFINGELIGRVSTVPWAMVFPNGGDFTRHPSQLYESLGEGVFLLCILSILFKYMSLRPGQLFACFLWGYGAIRFFLEFFRAPDPQLSALFLDLTMGQYLCSLMLLLGGAVWYFSSQNMRFGNYSDSKR